MLSETILIWSAIVLYTLFTILMICEYINVDRHMSKEYIRYSNSMIKFLIFLWILVTSMFGVFLYVLNS